jgi:hypothetical protein
VHADVFGQNFRELKSHRCTSPPKLNGLIDDACWKDCEVSSGFTSYSPNPGEPSKFETEVRVLYDDEALYIGFMCYDPSPDSILTQLTGRDSDGNSDFCGLTLSCFRDGINGFTFAISPKAEQYDARVSSVNGGHEEDISWNAVWDCKTSILDNGWCAEYKIPFAALRFPKAEEHIWNVNFFREVRRVRENSNWNPVDPQIPSFLAQMGQLKGLSEISTPSRLFLYPYASAYVNEQQFFNDEGGISSRQTRSYNGGMDLKYGLSDSFTLDATLIPDFGQTVSDNLILNLTPFEVQFQENRQFFTEGIELYSKAGLFYSRRIGGIPLNFFDVYNQLDSTETVIENPQTTQLINAAKVSGRTNKGLGIGFFNAVTAREHAVIEGADGTRRQVQTSPLTNYNVLVFDQNLKNNSYITLVNTNVLRDGSTYDANVWGTEFQLRNKKNSYALAGMGAFNKKYNYSASDDQGFTGMLEFQKIAGNYKWTAGSAVESDTYDINDLGFLYNNNEVNYWTSQSYQIFKPFGPFNRMWSNFFSSVNYLYEPYAFTNWISNANVGFMTRRFFAFELSAESQLIEGTDYFEPRTPGRYFKTPAYLNYGGWISTDYRKRLAIDLSSFVSTYADKQRYVLNWRVAPRFRVNDHLMLTYVYSQQNHFNDIGWADFADDSGQEPVFGTRDVISHTNLLNATYTFNAFMSMSFRARHYWGFSRYYKFHSLKEDGHLGETDYENLDDSGNPLANRSFNSFTIDMVYRWIFAPGSELNIVWKNTINHEEDQILPNLSDDIAHTFKLPQANSISMKVLYFLDYNKLRRKVES